jgi:serine/threonine-protein kinase
MYEMFTGKRPFNAGTRAELVKQAEEGMPPAPHSLVREIDPAIDSVILQCLAPDPRRRPQSALAISGALPGGDPLAAALAAGETPSPEMVAASGQTVGLAPKIALSCLSACVLGLGLWMISSQAFNVLFKIPLDNPPEVLTAKAREIAQRLGYTNHGSSNALGFEYRYGAMRLLHRLGDAHLAKSRPSSMTFWYRSSPTPLIPTHLADIPRVTRDDPAEDVPGMWHIAVDMQGRMRGFTAVPPSFEETKSAWPAPDWKSLFAAAGLDFSRFVAADPQWTPPVMADARAAWLGSYPEEPQISIRVEAAAFHGRPVSYVEILAPQSGSTPPAGPDTSTGDLVYLIVRLVVLVGSVPFARYNLKLGRGDTRGALRLGLFALSACLLSWMIGGTHVADPHEIDLFFTATMRATFGAVTLAVTYLSFEPFVRRRWPQTLVGWSRALAGSFRDPLVGRDVLLGALTGISLDLILGFGSWLYSALGIRGFRVSADPITLVGGRFLGGQFLFTIVDTLNKSLGILFLMFLARTLFRKQWLAAGLVVMVLAGIYAPNELNPWIGWGINILFFGVMVFSLMRFGLLVMAVGIFLGIFLNQYPLGTDFSVWYSGSMIFTLIVTLAIVAFGFRGSLAGRPLFKAE